jgi:hypothetical protein
MGVVAVRLTRLSKPSRRAQLGTRMAGQCIAGCIENM